MFNTNCDDGNGWLVLLVLLFALGGFNGGGGYGRVGGCGCGEPATITTVYDATNQQNVANSLNGIKEAVTVGSYDNARLVDSVNYNGMQNTNVVTQAINNGFNNVTSQITALGYQMSQCCCDLKTQMLQDKYDDVRYQLEQANTAIANATQSQYILGQLGRYVQNPPTGIYYGTTIA